MQKYTNACTGTLIEACATIKATIDMPLLKQLDMVIQKHFV